MDGQGRLTILVGGEVLGTGCGNGLVAADDSLDKAAHGLHAQGQRNHVEQQHVAAGAVASELVGLDGGPQRDDFVGVEIDERIAAKELGHGLAHLGHAGGTADQHHALHFVARQPCVLERAAHGRQRTCRQMGRARIEIAALYIEMHSAGRQLGRERCDLCIRQCLLAKACRHAPARLVLGRLGNHAGLLGHPLGQSRIVVVTPQGRIAASGDDLEHTLGQTQDRNVEGPATQVVDGVDAFGAVVQAVGNGCSRGLVDQAQQVDAGELCRILGGLALCIVKVGGHGDDGAMDVVIEGVFGTETQRGQDLGADLHGCLGAIDSLDPDHATAGLLLRKAVRQLFRRIDVSQRAAHEALCRGNGVARIGRQCSLGGVADLTAALGQIAHDRRQQHSALVIRQAFGHAIADSSDQRMRGAQVDAHGNAPLVGIGGLTGFGNLQKRHENTRGNCRSGPAGLPCE